jgi:hypothetical protein
MVSVRTVVVRSGTASGVAHAHCDGDQRDHHVSGKRADPDGGDRGEDGGAADQPRLGGERDAEVAIGGG